MKANYNSNKEYVAPELELISVVVEKGFEASVSDVTINPWENEDDSLEF